MEHRIQSLSKVTMTIIVAALATFALYRVWVFYTYAPWTRDGKVRAYTTQLAPDVSGLVTDVPVSDNQFVKAGDVVLKLDPSRFQIALDQALAQNASDRADYLMKRDQARRRALLDNTVITKETRSDSARIAEIARARLAASTAAVERARLDLDRATLRSPVDGYITNLQVRTGDYLPVGKPALAIVDRQSLWVYGYFEETKLRHVQVGSRARIELLDGIVLDGHVDSIAAGIADREANANNELLQDVNPIFNWIRLAQRIPVRIKLDTLPPHITAGMTCTVRILE